MNIELGMVTGRTFRIGNYIVDYVALKLFIIEGPLKSCSCIYSHEK